MVRNTYALAYEVKQDAFSLEQEIVRPEMESGSSFTGTLPKISEGSTMQTGSGRSSTSKAHGSTFFPKRNRKDPICFSPHLCRARNLVETVFNRIKLADALRLATTSRAFVQLASIRLWFTR